VTVSRLAGQGRGREKLMFSVKTKNVNGDKNTKQNIAGKRCELCPVCSSRTYLWKTKETHKFGKFNIDRCSKCGYAFVNPRPFPGFLREFYSVSGHNSDGGEKFSTLAEVLEQERIYPNSTVDAERIVSTVISLNPDCNTFLDVGSGYGFFLREALLNKLDVTAIEVAGSENEICEQLTKVKAFTVSFEDFQYEKNYFSIILMSQILEHAYDVNQWILKARRLLKPDGVLAIALPNFNSIFRLVMQENESYICPPAHLNFFTERSLANLLRKHGLNVCKVQYVSRVPYSALERRLAGSGIGSCFAKTLHRMMIGALKAVDMYHLGMMLNVYAKKTKA
jgi:SAM-dependent methyltransferase